MNRKLVITFVAAATIAFTGCGRIAGTSNIVNTNNSTNIEYYFTKDNGNPEEHLIQVINSSKSNLDIAIYSLTDKPIANAIVQAKKRGVNVEVITDRQEADSKSEKPILLLLKNNDIPVKINTHSGIMHMKVTVADKSIVTTGSYNYTSAASKINDENLVIINDPSIAKGFDDEFISMWDNNNDFKSW